MDKFLKEIEKILKLPMPQRVAILVITVALINAALVFFLIKPQLDKRVQLNSQLASLNYELVEKREIAANIPKFQQEMEDLKVKLRKALTQLPEESEIPELLKSVTKGSEKAGVDIVTFKRKKDVSKGFFAEVNSDIEVVGTYENIYRFCKNVSKLPRIVNLMEMKLTSKDKSVVSGEFDSPKLNIKFLLKTYKFVSKNPASR